jgi:hypothetical protein
MRENRSAYNGFGGKHEDQGVDGRLMLLITLILKK